MMLPRILDAVVSIVLVYSIGFIVGLAVLS
jgi:hypothetical protein